jgi:hypothetical protein
MLELVSNANCLHSDVPEEPADDYSDSDDEGVGNDAETELAELP